MGGRGIPAPLSEDKKLTGIAAKCFTVGAVSSTGFIADGLAGGDFGRILTGGEAENRISGKIDDFLSSKFGVAAEDLTPEQNKVCARSKLLGSVAGGIGTSIALGALTGYGGIASGVNTARNAQMLFGYRGAMTALAADDVVMTFDTTKTAIQFGLNFVH